MSNLCAEYFIVSHEWLKMIMKIMIVKQELNGISLMEIMLTFFLQWFLTIIPRSQAFAKIIVSPLAFQGKTILLTANRLTKFDSFCTYIFQDRKHRRTRAGSAEMDSQQNYDTDKSDNQDPRSNTKDVFS